MQMRVRLASIADPAVVHEVHVHPGRLHYIGRAHDVDLRLQDASVGRRVVVLTLEAGGVTVMDLGSGGGSRLNGVSRPPRTLLRNGDELQIGALAFRVALVPSE